MLSSGPNNRNVSGFSILLEEFNHLKISFICIKEQFDTSTPMGRAMMYVASVFAQLERETITERIRDNMMLFAQTRRWLGGNTPLGFESVKVTHEIVDGKVKKSFQLKPIESELDLVRLIYKKYREVRSFTNLETYLLQNGFKTRQEKDFSTTAIAEWIEAQEIAKSNQPKKFSGRVQNSSSLLVVCLFGQDVDLFYVQE